MAAGELNLKAIQALCSLPGHINEHFAFNLVLQALHVNYICIYFMFLLGINFMTKPLG